MRRLAFLLRPGWIALALVVVAFAYLCLTVLAPWQLGKNTKTSRENNRIANSLSAEPVPLKTELRSDNSMPDDAEWQRVTATGHYLPDRQVLARLRVVEGKTAFEALTVFQVDGGPQILVDRGYVRPEEGKPLPDVPSAPGGSVNLTARLRTSEHSSDKAPFTENGVFQVYSVDTQQVAKLTGTQLAAPYLQLTDDQPGGLGVIPLPQLDAGPFLSYGIQWIAFGIVAPIGLGYFVYSEIRQRRAAAATTKPTAPATTEERLADRYGRNR